MQNVYHFFLNSKVLSCPPTISSLYKFIDMFATLSTSFGRWCVCVCVGGGMWFYVRVKVRDLG